MGLGEPVFSTRSGSVRLNPPSYLVLGMVSLGVRSGYAIKKAADISTRFLWPTSLAQVYPELTRLERHGLLSRREDRHGARLRSAYTVTAEGRAALITWLRSYAPDTTPLQFRDEGALRLFFADTLDAGDQLTLVRQLRKRAQNASAHMRRDIIPAAEALEQDGLRFPTLVAHLGADTADYIDNWLSRLEKELNP